MNSLPAAAAVVGPTASAASNMTGNPSNAAMTPATHASLSAAPASAAAAVLVYREPVYNWQATKSTVKERFAFLFNNEVLSDVHFLVGKGMGVQRIPAHRVVNHDVFSRFLYSDEVHIGPETVMTTLYTAKKYAVPALEAHCVEFLKKNLRADNAFMLLTQARLFDEPQLASLCLENIDKNTGDALAAEGFTDIDLDTLVAVLERDTLGVREVHLFGAAVRWAEAEAHRQQLQLTPENKRRVLGKALKLIRFPLMTIEEFAAGPAQSAILTDRARFSNSCISDKYCPPNKPYINGEINYSGHMHLSKMIQTYNIIHTDSNTVLGQNDTGFSCDGSASTFRVMFKEPVEVLPNVNYTACATLKVPRLIVNVNTPRDFLLGSFLFLVIRKTLNVWFSFYYHFKVWNN
uniref:BTB (POZ) domain containing 2b n=1 Tax=Cyprinus carpio TaxID=7962 RepID=A0A8C2Q1E1_CYPCA